MEITNHLQKIKEAFFKVKKDISTLNNNLLILRNEKADKNTVNQLILEVNNLKKQIKELEEKKSCSTEKIVVKEECKELQLLGNIDSKKVHTSNCPFAKKIGPNHLVVFEDLSEALKMGYVRCSCVDK